MIVKLFDRTEIVISKTDGEKLSKSLLKSNEGMVTLNGYMVKKSAIAYVKPGGYTQPDLLKPNDIDKRLKSDNRSEDEQYRASRKAAQSVRQILEKRKV